jgi:quinol monooxygenase YgiN
MVVRDRRLTIPVWSSVPSHPADHGAGGSEAQDRPSGAVGRVRQMNGDDPTGVTEAPGANDVQIALVIMTFDAIDTNALSSTLARYVVLARGQEGCRNVDLCTSFTRPSRFVVVEKWESERHAREHFDSPLMVEMAEGCRGILTAPPEIDLLEGLSAHDLA